MSKTQRHSKVIYLVVALALVLSFSLVTAAPTLAAPIVTSVTETAFGTDTTDHNVNMPATIDAGDLLIVFFTNDGGAGVTTPSGWTQLASAAQGWVVRLSVYYKIATGTEGGTTVNFRTSTNEQAAAQVYRITNWHGTTPPEISIAVTGTDTTPDPASLDPAGWDVADTLWIAVAGQDQGDQSGTTDYPASYTDGISTLSPSGRGSCRTLSARRVLAAASEDPGAFTIPVAEEWVAFTIAVRPVRYDLSTSSTVGGNVTTPGEGVFSYDEGMIVDLVATPDAGYRFVNWTGDVGTIADVNAAATNITINGDYEITANFIAQYDLTIDSTVGGNVTTPGEGLFPDYDAGTVVDLAATPDAGYRFVNWTGDVGTIADVNAAATNITMNGDYEITANFIAQYDLTIDSTVGGNVTTPGEGLFPDYDAGTVVALVATQSAGYRFVNWTGDVGTIADVNAAAANITMNGDYEITANFIAQYDLTIDSMVGGNVTTPGEGLFSDYDVGTVVDLVATPDAGYRFVNWAGDVGTIADVNAAATNITMNGDYSVTANFIEESSTPPPWGSGGGCFIATAAYGTPTAEEINVLREFRDAVLLKSTVGSQFVALYYWLSPPIADFIAGSESLRTLVRELLIDPIVWVVEATGDMWRN